MISADGCYRLLLRAYPEDFRLAYAREMTLHFRDMRRDANSASAGFWFGMLWDVAKSAPVMRLQRMRSRWSKHNQTGEVAMRTMAILAMLVGCIEFVNSLIEARYGFQAGSGWSLAAGLDGAFAGALLIAAGVAMLRHSPKVFTWTLVAALYCLASFGLVLAIQPIYSIFASMLGIGFPIILLAFLFLRGRGSSQPRAA